MRRYSTLPCLTAVAGLLLGTLIASTGPAQGLETALPGLSGLVVTADQLGGSLNLIDVATGIVATVPVPLAPHKLDASPDGRWLLAAGESKGGGNGRSHDDGGAQGLLVMPGAARPGAHPVAEIPVGTRPAHVVADAEGRRAFVTNAGDDTVSAVDLAAQEVAGLIATGDYPRGVRARPGADELHLANVEDGTVSVIDIAQQVEVARIPVGDAPVQVGFVPDGSRADVSLRDEDAVAVIHRAAREVVAKAPVGSGPIQVHATPDGRSVYVASEGFEDEPPNFVSVIDTETDSVVATLTVGDDPHGVSVSDEAAFVASIRDGSLSVIDLASHDILATVPVGDGPNGIVYVPEAPN